MFVTCCSEFGSYLCQEIRTCIFKQMFSYLFLELIHFKLCFMVTLFRDHSVDAFFYFGEFAAYTEQNCNDSDNTIHTLIHTHTH